MKPWRYSIPFLFTFWMMTLVSNGQNWQWVTRMGGSDADGSPLIPDEEINDMVIDADGNIYACGRIRNHPNFNGTPITTYGGNDIFIAKFDCLGNPVWIRIAGNPDDGDEADALALDNLGHVYLTGRAYGDFGSRPFTFIDSTYHQNMIDMFIAKFDTSGNLIWIKIAAPGNDALVTLGQRMAIDSRGKVNILTSVGDPGILFPSQNVVTGVYIVRFDTSGMVDKLTYVIDSGVVTGWRGKFREFKMDSNDNFYIGSEFTSDSIVICGQILYRITTCASCSDLFLAKIDSSGNANWIFHKGKPGNSIFSVTGLSIDSNNDIYIAGNTTQDAVFGVDTLHNPLIPFNDAIFPYVAKLNSQGQVLWATNPQYQYPSNSSVRIQVKSNHNAIFSGMFNGLGIFGPDSIVSFGFTNLFVAEVSSTGTILSGTQLDGYSNDYTEPLNMLRNMNDEIFIGGAFSGDLRFNGNTVTSAGGYTDGFIAKWGSTSCTVGVPEINSSHDPRIIIYPNPCSNYFSIRYSDHRKIIKGITIRNLLGQVVVEKTVLNTTSFLTLDVSDLPTGIYSVTLNGTPLLTSKLVVTH